MASGSYGKKRLFIAVVRWSLLVLIVRFPYDTHGAETPWKIGLAATDITPEKPIWMRGYASRKAPSSGVESPLKAKALMLEDAEGARALLVTADLCILSKSYAESVCRRIVEATGLRRDQILINVSHTHTGPVVANEAPYGFNVPEDQQERIREYSARLSDKLVELAGQAATDPIPARLSFGTGVASFVMNRRESRGGKIRLGVNPKGFADRSVPVLRVDDEKGNPRVVIFGCACHCTTIPPTDGKISGDYAGYAQTLLEDNLGGAQAMFITGCGGSANPYPRRSEALARQHGEELGNEVLRVLQNTNLGPVRPPLRTVFEIVTLPLRPVPERPELERLSKGPTHQSFVARKMIALLDEGAAPPSAYEAPFSVWQFGSDLTLIGMSGEVVGEYVPLISEAVGLDKLWTAGYCHEVFGYLPTRQTLREGGYETRGLFVEAGWFAPEVEDTVVKTVKELVRQAGRP